MGCLGVHFGLDERTVGALKSQPSDQARLNYLLEEIEEDYFDSHKDWMAETDKAWDAIHRTLTDGRIAWGNGAFPLSHVILGGESLYQSDDYIMSLKSVREVKEIAHALRQLTEDEFRMRFLRIDPEDYGFPVDNEHLKYVWHWFSSMRELYYRAADAGRYVLFTASQ